MTRYELTGPDASFSVDVVRAEGGFQISMGGKTFSIALERTGDPGVLVAHFTDKPLKVILEEATDRRVVLSIGGERLVFEKPLPLLVTAQGTVPTRTSSNDLLTAPMPGRIIGIMAKKGDQAKVGDPVAIIESMKMESVIRSDRDAEIGEVLLAEGATVKRGQALVRFVTKAIS